MNDDSTKLPTLRYEIGTTVVPGDRIGTIRQVRSGNGTYVKGGHIYSSLVGKLIVTTLEIHDDEQQQQEEGPPFICQIVTTTSGDPAATAQVLKIGQIVIGEIVRVTPQSAIVDVRVAENVGVLKVTHEGAINKEDVKAGTTTGSTSKEQGSGTLLEDSFHPNDLVVCRIISLGDSRRYFLSTAEPNLGVIRAICQESNEPMIPISFKEMECPITGKRELRKVAKPK